MSRPSTERTRRRISLLVVLAATIPYLNSLPGDFTFDDIGVIRDNPTINDGPTFDLFMKPYEPGTLYRPVTMLTYVVNVRLGGVQPLGFHVLNVVLHAAVSVLILRLGITLLRTATAAVAAALLFAVHPIHAEAVSSIVGRAEILAALCVLVMLLAFVASLKEQGMRRLLWLSLSTGALCVGVLAKESAFATIALIPVTQRWLYPGTPARRLAAAAGPYVAVGLGYLGLRLLLIGSLQLPVAPGLLENPLAHVATLPRLMTATVVLWEYLSSLALPVQLSADYSFNQIPVVLSPLEPRFLLAATATSVTLAGALVFAPRAPQLLLAALFFLLPLSLTANVLFPIGTIKAERLLYLPSAGWCLALGCLAELAARRGPTLCLVACAALTAGCGARTWIRNGDWQDGLTLFTATVDTSPASAKAHYNLGVNYERAGRMDEALSQYRLALAILPDYAAAAGAIGFIYNGKGNPAAALHWYERALQLDWSSAKAHLQTGIAWQGLGNYDTAEAAFRTGLESEPEDPYLLVSLSAVRLDQGDFWDAVGLLRHLDDVGPGAGRVAEIAGAARREIEERLR